MREVGLAGAIIAVVGLFIWMASAHSGSSSATGAPDIAIPLVQGGPAQPLSSLHGKVVMLDFWATWCGPCKMSMPVLEKLYKQYHSKGLEIVGISVDGPETQRQIPAVQKALGITYPLVIGESIPDIRTKVQFSGIPTLYVIDKQGQVQYRSEGYDMNYDLAGKVKQLLAE